MLNTSYNLLCTLKICLQSLPILSWKMERYLSFPFHEYLLLQKNNQRKYPPLFPRVHYHISSMCSFVFYSLPCLPSPVNVHLPEFTVCLSLGSFKSNSGTSLTSPSPCSSWVWSILFLYLSGKATRTSNNKTLVKGTVNTWLITILSNNILYK